MKLGLIAAALLLSAATAQPALAHPAHHPGDVVRAEALPAALWLPGTADARRLTYTSTSATGKPVVVSGTVFVPAGTAPAHGWPVVSWTHGTLGVADKCANSTAGRSQRDIDYLSHWLGAGYAVVASDYEGLGTPGEHPYLNGTSEAHGAIDMVRAARKLVPSLSRRWIAVGQSQGAQAALFVGSIEHRYAPELDYRGTIATAPPSKYPQLVAAYKPFGPGGAANPFTVYVLAGLDASYRNFDPARYLTPYGQEVFAKVKTTDCFIDTAIALAGRPADDVYAVDAAEQTHLLRLLDRDAEIPITRYREPVFVAQGTTDTVVYPPATTTTVNQLQQAGTEVTYTIYPNTDHNGVVPAATQSALLWAAARFK